MNGKIATTSSNARASAVRAVLNDPMRDRGAAFTQADPEALGLTGQLPSAVTS